MGTLFGGSFKKGYTIFFFWGGGVYLVRVPGFAEIPKHLRKVVSVEFWGLRVEGVGVELLRCRGTAARATGALL